MSWVHTFPGGPLEEVRRGPAPVYQAEEGEDMEPFVFIVAARPPLWPWFFLTLGLSFLSKEEGHKDTTCHRQGLRGSCLTEFSVQGASGGSACGTPACGGGTEAGGQSRAAAGV